MHKFSIITPCFNAEKHIVHTVESVLSQTALLSGRTELEYIICDGKSGDRTLELVKQVIERYGNPPVRIISGEDKGMYHALAKGLDTMTGNYCGYINAGDFYLPHAFDVVLDVFENGEMDWITGLICTSNEKNQITAVHQPFTYRRRLTRTGFHGLSLPYIQQESTFWRSKLNSRLDLDRLSCFRYAGDFYMWNCFAGVSELETVEALLGSFKIHAGQLSENKAGYAAEMAAIAEKPGLLDLLLACYDRVIWHAPPRVKKALGWDNFIAFDHDTQRWLPRSG